MKLLAPITAAAVIAAASAGQIYAGQSAESYANSAELYQSALENQQHGLYSAQSQAPQTYGGHEATYNSRPAGEKIAKIIKYKSEDSGHQYQYSFETDNGIHTQENGKIAEHGTSTHGAYSYTGDDGKVYTVTYTADENGFHPQGDHLPTPPPIPHDILKSLEYNAKHEASGINDDGKYRQESGYSIGHGSGGSGFGASNGYQQYDGGYQNLGYQASSGHEAAAELAYRGQAGQNLGAHYSQAGQDSGSYYGQAGQDLARLAYHSQASGPELAYRGQISQGSGGKIAYRGQARPASGAKLAYRGQGSAAEQVYNSLRTQAGGSSGGGHAYQSYSNNGGQSSLGRIVVGYSSDGEQGYAKH